MPIAKTTNICYRHKPELLSQDVMLGNLWKLELREKENQRLKQKETRKVALLLTCSEYVSKYKHQSELINDRETEKDQNSIFAMLVRNDRTEQGEITGT